MLATFSHLNTQPKRHSPASATVLRKNDLNNIANEFQSDRIDATFVEALKKFDVAETKMLKQHLPLSLEDKIMSSSVSSNDRFCISSQLSNNASDGTFQKLSSFTTIYNELDSTNEELSALDELKDEVTKFTEGIMVKLANIATTDESANAPGTFITSTLQTQRNGTFYERDSVDDGLKMTPKAQKRQLNSTLSDDTPSPKKTKISNFGFKHTMKELSTDNSQTVITDTTSHVAATEMAKFYSVLSTCPYCNDVSGKSMTFDVDDGQSRGHKPLLTLKTIKDKNMTLSDKYIDYTMKAGMQRFLLLLDKLLTTLDCFSYEKVRCSDKFEDAVHVEKELLYERIFSIITTLTSKPFENVRETEASNQKLAKRCFVMLNKLCIPNDKIDQLTDSFNSSVAETLDDMINNRLKPGTRFKARYSDKENISAVHGKYSKKSSVSRHTEEPVVQRSNPITFSLKSGHGGEAKSQVSKSNQSSNKNVALRKRCQSDSGKNPCIDVVSIPLPEECNVSSTQARPFHTEVASHSSQSLVDELATFIATQTRVNKKMIPSDNQSVQAKIGEQRKKMAIRSNQREPATFSKSNKTKHAVRASETGGVTSKSRSKKDSKSGSSRLRQQICNYLQQRCLCDDMYTEYRKTLIHYFQKHETMKKSHETLTHSKPQTKMQISQKLGQLLGQLKEMMRKINNIVTVMRRGNGKFRSMIVNGISLSRLLQKLSKDIVRLEIDTSTVKMAQGLLTHLKSSACVTASRQTDHSISAQTLTNQHKSSLLKKSVVANAALASGDGESLLIDESVPSGVDFHYLNRHSKNDVNA